MAEPMKPAHRHSHQPELEKPETTLVFMPKKIARTAAARTPIKYSGIGRTIHIRIAHTKTISTPLPCASSPVNGTSASSAQSTVRTAATIRRFLCCFSLLTLQFLFSFSFFSRQNAIRRRLQLRCQFLPPDKKDQLQSLAVGLESRFRLGRETLTIKQLIFYVIAICFLRIQSSTFLSEKQDLVKLSDKYTKFAQKTVQFS